MKMKKEINKLNSFYRSSFQRRKKKKKKKILQMCLKKLTRGTKKYETHFKYGNHIMKYRNTIFKLVSYKQG